MEKNDYLRKLGLWLHPGACFKENDARYISFSLWFFQMVVIFVPASLSKLVDTTSNIAHDNYHVPFCDSIKVT